MQAGVCVNPSGGNAYMERGPFHTVSRHYYHRLKRSSCAGRAVLFMAHDFVELQPMKGTDV